MLGSRELQPLCKEVTHACVQTCGISPADKERLNKSARGYISTWADHLIYLASSLSKPENRKHFSWFDFPETEVIHGLVLNIISVWWLVSQEVCIELME